MEELLKKVGNVATLAVDGFNFITGRESGETWACIVVAHGKKSINAVVGKKSVFPISDCVALCAMDVQVEYQGDSEPDTNGAVYPRLRISKYTPKGR